MDEADLELCTAAGDEKTYIRNSALELYDRLNKTALLNPPPSSPKERQALSVHYDLSTSVGYLAGLMPSAYTAALNVLTVTRDRLGLIAEGEGEKWIPDRLVDYGSGTGSAAWAFEEVWGVQKENGEPREYFGLEASINMVELSSVLFGALPLRSTSSDGPATSAKLDAKSFQVVLPASSSTLSKLQLHPKSMKEKKTVALAAFTLGDLGSREKRKDLIRSMWDSGAEVLVVIDRGTPAGSRMVIEAREQLLMFGRREVSRARRSGEVVEVDQDLLDAGFEIVSEEGEEVGEVDPSLGSFVVAPVRLLPPSYLPTHIDSPLVQCPHDGACPLHHSTKTHCHFSQRGSFPPSSSPYPLISTSADILLSP
jgi:ribosomal protein RSM22 (predicted rRNA methylase)